MQKYFKPEIEIIEVDDLDIIQTSTDGETPPDTINPDAPGDGGWGDPVTGTQIVPDTANIFID